MTTVKTPIKGRALPLAGVRYRFAFARHRSRSRGYWKRYYNRRFADGPDDADPARHARRQLPGIAPGVPRRVRADSFVGGFAQLDVPLVLSNGDIGSAKSYGRGTIIAFDFKAGVQNLVGDHYAIVIAAIVRIRSACRSKPRRTLKRQRAASRRDRPHYGITAGIGICTSVSRSRC